MCLVGAAAVCQQTLTVRHTFWEVVEMSLKEKKFGMSQRKSHDRWHV